MRERIRDKERLVHMLTAIDNLLDGSKRYTMEQAEQDAIIFFGFVKQLEIIGEATYKLTCEFRESHPETPWHKMEGMRHVLVHGYYLISPAKVWLVINNDLPVLRPQIEAYIKEEESGTDNSAA
ncbi:MAG: DUF86 domain-containing protein [Paludibacteraceae bacterium]|nr:DUF86 domain-containing protein [Paludibacteraceae bacterium]